MSKPPQVGREGVLACRVAVVLGLWKGLVPAPSPAHRTPPPTATHCHQNVCLLGRGMTCISHLEYGT